MSDWRDQILKEFAPGVQPITAVADPDGLLTEPRLGQALAERGFESLLFEDSLSFRFAYESRFRSRLDAGRSVDLVVLLGDDASSLVKLPYDVLSERQEALVRTGGCVSPLQLSSAARLGATVFGPVV